MKHSHLGTARSLCACRRLCLAAGLWLVAVSASWAADELPIITAPSKLHWIGTDQVDAKAETVVFEKTFALEKKPTGGRIRPADAG